MLEKYTNPSPEYYQALREITPAQLAQEWQEITQEQADYLLDVLPPIRFAAGAFMVGECLTHSDRGALYEAVISQGGRWFARPAYLQTFNPESMRAEIRAQFNLIKAVE